MGQLKPVLILKNGVGRSELDLKLISKFPYDTVDIKSTRMVLFEKALVPKFEAKQQKLEERKQRVAAEIMEITRASREIISATADTQTVL